MKYSTIEVARELETPVPPIYVPDLTTTVGKLRHLRHVVEQIPPERFNMNTIMRASASCGTVGCMLGWAAVDPAFNEDGLSLRYGQSTVTYPGTHIDAEYDVVAAAAFGIELDDALDLFTWRFQSDDERTADVLTISHGLARIDRMIAKYSAGES